MGLNLSQNVLKDRARQVVAILGDDFDKVVGILIEDADNENPLFIEVLLDDDRSREFEFKENSDFGPNDNRRRLWVEVIENPNAAAA